MGTEFHEDRPRIQRDDVKKPRQQEASNADRGRQLPDADADSEHRVIDLYSKDAPIYGTRRMDKGV